MGIISNIKNRIQMDNYNRERDNVIKKWIINIGDIIEEEDKIICYVKQEKLIEECRKTIDYLELDGLFRGDKFYIDYLNRLNLDKPVYYIFDGINFEWWFKFKSKWNCNVTFKNCNFRKGLFIKEADNVIFENNTYYDYYNSSCLRYSDYLTCENIGKLTFKNEKFVNMAMGMVPNNFGININTDIIKIIDSHIDCGESGDINISANKMIVMNSDIDVGKLIMIVDKLIYFNSNINAKDRVVINNKNKDYIGYISAPMIIYNGVMVVPINVFLKDVSEIGLINNARTELVLKLYQISMLCQKIEDRKIQATRRMLDEQPISIISRNNDTSYEYKEELLKKTRLELIKKLSDIRDYYLLVSNMKVDNVKNNFSKQSISRVLKRDDLGF